MISTSHLIKGWKILSNKEKTYAFLVLLLVILSAASSAIMVGSIMPFLTVLADTERIREVEIFAALYSYGNFKSDHEFLVALGILSLIVIFASNIIQVMRVIVLVRFATMRMHHISRRLFSVYLRQPYTYFLGRNSADLGSQILSESQNSVQYFYRPAAEICASVFTVIAVSGFLLWINFTVAVVSFLLAGGIYAGSFLLSRKHISRQGTIRAAENQNRFRISNEALTGIKEVKLLGKEHSYQSAYSVPSRRVAAADASVGIISQIPQYVMYVVAFGGMILLCLALLNPSELAGGDPLSTLLPLLGVFAFAGQRLIPELSKLYSGITQLNYGAPIIDAIYDELEWERMLPPIQPTPTKPLALRNRLELTNVSFKYPEAKAPSVSDITLRIEAGERIGVAGHSGSGKTTLINLILGLLAPTSGSLEVDGKGLSTEAISSWQRSVSYVQQDIFLSDASIFENIAFGTARDEIDPDRVRDAARLAQLDDFILSELPDGYNTRIGERGVRLSGGQRQRIGIARAMYNSADLIIFDEATSALDNATERQVMEAIEGLPSQLTIILIAHRLSTLCFCDKIAVMKDGRLSGFGTWDELEQKNSDFQLLVSSQGKHQG